MSDSPKASNTLVVFISLLLLAALLLSGFVFYEIKRLNEEASNLNNQSLAIQAKEGKLLSTKVLLAGTEEERARLDSYFFGTDSVVLFIEKLEYLGRVAGVDLTISTVGTDPKRPNFLKASFIVSGSFEKIYHLFSLLEALPYEINIQRMTLGKNSTVIKNGTWSSDVSIELLSFVGAKKK